MQREPASRADQRPFDRGAAGGAGSPLAADDVPAGSPPAARDDDRPAWWPSAATAPGTPEPSRAQQLLAWLRPTPAELVGLVLLVLGSVVATLVWWGQSVTGPAGVDQLNGVGPEVTAGGHPDAHSQPTAHDQPDVVPEVTASPAPTGVGTRPDSAAVAVTVHVSGAVSRAGLVTLPAGGRVGDAVVAAGGLTADADTARVNLARALTDGEHVHLPRLGEDPPMPDVGPDDGTSPSAADTDAAAGAGPLDLNRASASELEQLPGIGPVRAAAIVEHREHHGPFAVPGDLRAVPGIGEATFQTLAPLVVAR